MRSSRGEVRIAEILEMNDIIFKEEYSFDGLVSLSGSPLRFDFAVFDEDENLEFLIEYQGRQHYEAVSKFGGTSGFHKQQYNDNKKRQFCKLHNITLIEIPYTEELYVDFDYIMKKAGY